MVYVRAELGLYPGVTSFGMDTRQMRKKFVPKKPKKSRPALSMRNDAIEALRNFGK